MSQQESTPHPGQVAAIRAEDPGSGISPPSIPPIYQTAAFDFADVEALRECMSGESDGFLYTRESNPNHSLLANVVAEMEGAEAGVVCASGMGAFTGITMALLKSGDHVLVSRVLYGTTLRLFGRLSDQFRIEVTAVDATDPAAVAAARRSNTRLFIVETLSNPLLEVADLPALRSALPDVTMLVDSSFTTPHLIQPIAHGADLVMHSASKYLNGHGDVMSGVVVGRAEQIDRIAESVSIFGCNANPFDSWLTLRGMRTLQLRMEHVSRSALAIAEWLRQQASVDRVCYPGLADHPTRAAAQSLYQNGTGGVVTFSLKEADESTVSRFMRAAAMIPFSPTLADARTTLSHPRSTSHRHLSDAEGQHVGILPGMIRLSVGLEPSPLLIAELTHALREVAAQR